jgi:hypothetical protein
LFSSILDCYPDGDLHSTLNVAKHFDNNDLLAQELIKDLQRGSDRSVGGEVLYTFQQVGANFSK